MQNYPSKVVANGFRLNRFIYTVNFHKRQTWLLVLTCTTIYLLPTPSTCQDFKRIVTTKRWVQCIRSFLFHDNKSRKFSYTAPCSYSFQGENPVSVFRQMERASNTPNISVTEFESHRRILLSM